MIGRGFLVLLALLALPATTEAQPQAAKKTKVAATKKAAPAKIQTQTKVAAATVSAPKPMPSRAPAFDPNHAVEIRGQSRTLSMMLVLKNGKENINFIKIRKDYNPEIANTPF